MKSYYNQEKIASSFYKFFSKFSLSKPHFKSLCYAIIGMIVAESVVTSDFSRKLKDDFLLFNFSLLNVVLGVSLNPSLLLLILFMKLLFPM